MISFYIWLLSTQKKRYSKNECVVVSNEVKKCSISSVVTLGEVLVIDMRPHFGCLSKWWLRLHNRPYKDRLGSNMELDLN